MAGPVGCVLEDPLQQVVMITIQAPRRQRSPTATQDSVHYFMVGSRARYHRQPDIGPELSLAAKAVRGAYYCQQLRHAHRPKLRHTHQPGIGLLSPRFFNHYSFGFVSQWFERRQLLIQEACPLFRSSLRQLLQPLLPSILTIDIMTRAADRPAAIDCL